MELGLVESAVYNADVENYPNGCHICELDIDAETGEVEILRYSIVDDVGAVINPLLLEGQICGGVAQGMGQALLEDIRFDGRSGQILTGSFMDYAMPRADDFSASSQEQSGADPDQPARRQRRGRSRLRWGAAGGRECRCRCPLGPRHPPHRHAGDAGAHLAPNATLNLVCHIWDSEVRPRRRECRPSEPARCHRPYAAQKP